MRIEQITFTRFIAAISIVIFHYGRNVFPFKIESISFLFNQANIGVSYFFILSGFVMIIAYGQKVKINTIDYLKNRFARIYPVYFLAIILLLIFFTITSSKIDFYGLILNIFLIQSWIPGQALSFNYPGWSLAVEFLFYLAFPFLFNYVYSKFDFKRIVIPILFIWVVSQICLHIASTTSFYKGFPSKSHDLIYYFPIMHLNEFLMGNLAGLFFINKLRTKKINIDWLIVLLLLILFALLRFNTFINFHNGFLMIIFIPLIISFSLNNGILSRFSNHKFCVFLGEISYGIYILQVPIFLWVRAVFSHFGIHSNFILFYLSLIILIMTSAVSYFFIETPLRKKIKKLHITAGHSQ